MQDARSDHLQPRARAEGDAVVSALREHGVEVSCSECSHRRIIKMALGSGAALTLHVWNCRICDAQNATAYNPRVGFRPTQVFEPTLFDEE